jgi:hypothetical protein
VEHPPTDPNEHDDETLLGDADELDHPSIEEQLDDRLQSEQDDEQE